LTKCFCPVYDSNLTDDAEGTSSLAVEAHVLGVGLSEADVVAVAQELTDSESVTVDVTCDAENFFLNSLAL